MRGMFLLGLAVGVWLVVLLVWGLSSTGPNCPGMDPGYIGLCR